MKKVTAFKRTKRSGFTFDKFNRSWYDKFEKMEEPLDEDGEIIETGNFSFYDPYCENSLYGRKLGIMVEVSVCKWNGNQLLFDIDENIIKERTCSTTKKLKIVLPKNGHTSYGGRIFIGEWRKHISVWAWDTVEQDCPGCYDCQLKVTESIFQKIVNLCKRCV